MSYKIVKSHTILNLCNIVFIWYCGNDADDQFANCDLFSY